MPAGDDDEVMALPQGDAEPEGDDDPLAYPGIDSYANAPLSTSEFLESRRAPPLPRRQSTPPKARRAHEPGPDAVLKAKIVEPSRALFRVGETVTIHMIVYYSEPHPRRGKVISGYKQRDLVKILFDGREYKEPGPHNHVVTTTGKKTLKVAAVPKVGPKKGKTVTVATMTIDVICGEALPAGDVGLVACTIFVEGGSYSGTKERSDNEMYAIAWSIRNRLTVLNDARGKDAAKWNFLAGRFLDSRDDSAAVTYQQVIEHDQAYTGAYKAGRERAEFTRCKNPADLNTAECARFAKCVEVARNVVANGAPDDPFRARGQDSGNPHAPGVFYYKVKGNTSPTGEDPLPPLTTKDIHYHWGLERSGPFK